MKNYNCGDSSYHRARIVRGMGKYTETRERVLWFLFSEKGMLVEEQDGRLSVPKRTAPDDFVVDASQSHYLGSLDGIPCYAARVPSDRSDGTLPRGTIFKGLREVLGSLEDTRMGEAVSYASEVLHWDQTHRYCGQCGTHMENKREETAKICPRCGLNSYPRITPAIIVGVRNVDRILLVRAHRHRAGLYSNVAGFVEAGEALEHTVAREIREETGITVKNIRYVGSQSWPFPSTLMIGFTAEYESGEIRREKAEIQDVRWFSIHELPDIPNRYTIARAIIDRLVAIISENDPRRAPGTAT